MKDTIIPMKKLLIFLIILIIANAGCSKEGLSALPIDEKASSESNYETKAVSPKVSETGAALITCYNVGKGDAFLIRTDNSAVMIDTGYKDDFEMLLSSLMDQGVSKLDMLIISHFDKDHVGAASKLVKALPIERIYTTRITNDNKRTVKFLEALEKTNQESSIVTETLQMDIDGINYTIYPALKEDYSDKDDNNSSLAVSMRYKDFSMLFTGDAQDERMAELLELKDLDTDVLKVPYHGHFQQSLPKLIELTSPDYSILTSSDDSPEDIETIEALNRAGSRIYRTRDGDIRIHTDGQMIEFEGSEYVPDSSELKNAA